jgi:hypothetical protein
MIMRLREATVIGATITIVGLGTPALAQTDSGVEPEVFAGPVTCTTPEIVAFCNLSNPVELAISPPKNNARNIFTSGTVNRPAFSGQFRVAVTVAADSTFSFEDLSLVGVSESQQADTPGVECVISRSSSLANVYRRVNWLSDSGLMPPSGSVGQIKFCWSEGPCKEVQSNVGSSCTSWNQNDSTPGAHFLQGHLATPDQPLNLCGCPPVVARLCDPTVPAGQGGCFAAGAGLTSLDTQAATTAAEGSSPPAALGLSILAATPTCSGSTPCLTTKTYRIGGTTVNSQVCVAESTADTNAICP